MGNNDLVHCHPPVPTEKPSPKCRPRNSHCFMRPNVSSCYIRLRLISLVPVLSAVSCLAIYFAFIDLELHALAIVTMTFLSLKWETAGK